MKKTVAVIRNGKIVYGVHADATSPNETEARANREAMKTKYRGELLQPTQPDYYKKYPKQAENLSPEVRRLLS